MHPYQHAEAQPDKLAFVMPDTGQRLTYRDLDRASNQGAHLFRQLGLKAGDRVGMLLPNGPEIPILYWSAQRSGLFIIPLSTHLRPPEVAYILGDGGAKLLVTSDQIGETAQILAAQRDMIAAVDHVLNMGSGTLEGAPSWQNLTDDLPATPIADEIAGYYIPYSSGTTGRPKGIVLDFEAGPIDVVSPNERASIARYKTLNAVITFNSGPLYHGAPLSSLVSTQRFGGTAVVLKKFDAEQVLKAIEEWDVTYAQFVPTMFVRMLALPEATRKGYDLSSLQMIIHAAAPCPVEIKRRMIDWLGPIVHEYYGASEGNGQTYITPQEWLERPGSVGKAVWGKIHICDEAGNELPANTDGLIYFESGRPFRYLNDPEKTAKAHHKLHSDWTALSDIGHVDEEGYLFLTDRKDFMIISGGVNIYPQAVEDCLIGHPDVLDVAVIGVPNPDFGEEVKAIVQLVPTAVPSEGMAEGLKAWCRERISSVTCPRTIEFVEELPRLPTGKLAKHELKRLFAN